MKLFTKEAKNILKTGNAESSQHKYQYHQKKHEDWVLETNSDPMEQTTMVNYMMVLSKEFQLDCCEEYIAS